MKLLKKNTKISLVFNLFLVFVLAIFFFNYFGQGKKNFELFALNNETTKKIEVIDDKKIICTGFKDKSDCINISKNKSKKIIILLGNSQLFAINQMKAGDHLTSYHLSKKLKKEDINLITFAMPNGSLTEHLIIYEFLNNNFTIDTLILPLVFDDLRESKIRTDISNFFKETKFKNSFLTTEHKKRIFKKIDLDPILVEKKNTTQEKSERKILNFLNLCCNYEEKRDGITGRIYVSLFNLRNTIFNITPLSKRKLLAASYKQNINSFIEIINITKKDRTKLLTYIAPIRNDIEIPYIKDEYQKFKQEVFKLSKTKKFNHLNLENLVPNSLWGTAGGTKFGVDKEVDFMHFKGEGHKILSQKIINTLSNDF